MHALASLFDDRTSEAVRDLWDQLEQSCGLTGIRQTPIPHLSWLLAEDLDLNALSGVLDNFAREAVPFDAVSAGLGAFGGVRPVLFISVVKTEALLRMHRSLWDLTHLINRDLNNDYSPDRWMPHITLAHDGLDASSLACAVSLLAPEDLNWPIRIDNLALIYQETGQVGRMHSKYEFGA